MPHRDARRLIPPSVHVIVRDWLSSNHVLLRDIDGHVLVDTGYSRHAPMTLALLRGEAALGAQPLALVVNTHCHSDHIGGNALLARTYGCPILVPEGEADIVGRWDERALLLTWADQRAERFAFEGVLCAGDRHFWGGLEWETVAAPGHDMGALVFFNAEHGVLISGDALWENGFGFVLPPEMDPACLPAARAALEAISRLPVRVVIPGHGEPFAEVGTALERAWRRLEAMEADSNRIARSILKGLLVYALLDHQRMPLAALPRYFEEVPCYREINELFFRLPARELAQRVLEELRRGHAVRIEEGWLMPA